MPSEFESDCEVIFKQPEAILWGRILGGEQCPVPESIIWFHATRVRPGTTFENGILPLDKCVNRIEAFLAELAASVSVDSIADGDSDNSVELAQGNFHYGLKTTDAKHFGPWAFLTRDAIIDPDGATGAYTETPVIVEDIAGQQYGACATVVLEAFRRATRPHIVHFRDEQRLEGAIEVALAYCYSGLHNIRPLGRFHTCYSGAGKTIPRERIVKVEDLGAAT